MAELGLVGVSAPEADGGLGAGLFGAAWVIEAVAASSGTLAVMLALPAVLPSVWVRMAVVNASLSLSGTWTAARPSDRPLGKPGTWTNP